MCTPLEHEYLRFAETCSMESSEKISSSSVESIEDKTRKTSLNLKRTELRLGLPGSHSPDLESNDTSNGFGVTPLKKLGSGAKRDFSYAIDGPNEKWVFPCDEKNLVPPANDHVSAPSTKAELVGWRPVGSFQKNKKASNFAKKSDETSGDGGRLYVKVSMDGAPYLRNVDLKTYNNYMELSSALERIFSCFTIGECSGKGVAIGCEYVVTYEDKDGDWMLVGDVPWRVLLRMFTDSCLRLRIMKSSETLGLASKGHAEMHTT
ncbi:hypothetical protein V6Z12_D10G072800 [Gossypium hirsutum]|uniref:Auxin-responsive protein n=1 Tax=Gossypium tomentosum TaxID=34277 RepID=A0A5D2J1Y8_GOSTO|nr:hypothetical protein ES332_D10G077600v1 [Gossypium tomentosum]